VVCSVLDCCIDPDLLGGVLRTLSQQSASRMHTFARESVGTNLAHLLLAHFVSESEKEISEMPENGSINEGTTGTTGTTGTGTGTATALSQTAQDYGQKITEAANTAKDYLSDKVSVVGDKFKELQNADLGELAENAKQYARQKPGQALLISAAAGLLLGLIIRGRR